MLQIIIKYDMDFNIDIKIEKTIKNIYHFSIDFTFDDKKEENKVRTNEKIEKMMF